MSFGIIAETTDISGEPSWNNSELNMQQGDAQYVSVSKVISKTASFVKKLSSLLKSPSKVNVDNNKKPGEEPRDEPKVQEPKPDAFCKEVTDAYSDYKKMALKIHPDKVCGRDDASFDKCIAEASEVFARAGKCFGR